jgi:hypothetical protein
LQGSRFEPNEQLFSLSQLQVLSGSYVINFGTNSNLNLPWILKGFKGVQTFWEKSGKFIRSLSWSDLPKYEFSWPHLYAGKWSFYTSVPLSLFEIKEKSLNWKFKLNQPYISFKLCNYMVKYCWNIIAATVTLGVSHSILKVHLFRFENFCVDQLGFLELVEAAWNTETRCSSSTTKVAAKFKLLERVLKWWAKGISMLKAQLKHCNEILLILDKPEESIPLYLIERNFRGILKIIS